MPTFVFKDPTGKTYNIAGPDGATQEQAFAMLQQHLGAAPVATPPATPPAAGSGTAPSPLSQSDRLVGQGEELLHLGTGAVAGAAGLTSAAGTGVANFASHLVGGGDVADPRANMEAVQNDLTYQPRTAAGKAIAAAGAAPGKYLQGSTDYVADKAATVPVVGPALGAAVKAAPAIAGAVLGRGAPEAEGLPAVSTPADVAATAVPSATRTPLQVARGADYVAPPSVVRNSNPAGGNPAGLLREALTNSPTVAKRANLQNQATSTRLAGEDLGMENATKITDADVEKYRTLPGATYDATATRLGDIPPNAEAVSNLNEIATNPNPANAVPPKASANISRIANKISSGNYTGTDWRTDVSWLRANGARDAANELEDLAANALQAKGDGQGLTAFTGARQAFAKSYDIQHALSRGQIDAQALAALDKRTGGKVLTGNLKTIAMAADELPEVTRIPQGGTSDLTTPGTHGISGLLSGLHQVLGSAIRHAIPGTDVLSPGFQARNFGAVDTPAQASYRPGLNVRGTEPFPGPGVLALKPSPGAVGPSPLGLPTAPTQQLGMALAEGRVRPPAELTPPEGEVGVYPRQSGMQLPPGRAAAPIVDLTPPEGTVGVTPVQQGLELPTDFTPRVELSPPEGQAFEPHQPQLPFPPKEKGKGKGKKLGDTLAAKK